MSFLLKLDEYRQTYIDHYVKKDNPYTSTNNEKKNSAIYINIDFPHLDTICSFYVLKRARASLIMKVGDQHIYLSDIDIVNTILKMDDADKDWFIKQFVQAYKGKYSKYSFHIDDILYSGIGLPLHFEGKKLLLHTDSVITYNDFIILINFVITKDYQSAMDTSNKSSWNSTIRKYIVLIDYYYKAREESSRYLNSINYNLGVPSPYEDRDIKKEFKNVISFDISCYE